MYYSTQFAFLVLLLYFSSLEISDVKLRSSDVGIRVSDVDVSHLGEESPPLPVLEFEVTGTVPLNDLHGAQLLLTFTESPKKTNKQTKKNLMNDRQEFFLKHLKAVCRPRVGLTCGPGSLWPVLGRR